MVVIPAATTHFCLITFFSQISNSHGLYYFTAEFLITTLTTRRRDQIHLAERTGTQALQRRTTSNYDENAEAQLSLGK